MVDANKRFLEHVRKVMRETICPRVSDGLRSSLPQCSYLVAVLAAQRNITGRILLLAYCPKQGWRPSLLIRLEAIAINHKEKEERYTVY